MSPDDKRPPSPANKHPKDRPNPKKKTKAEETFRPEVKRRFLDLLLDGKTRAEACAEMGISYSLFSKYCQLVPKFHDAVDNACAEWDNRIVDSMKRRAEGYTYTERRTVRETIRDPKTGKPMLDADGKPIIAMTISETVKFVPPDTAAGIFWLKNRRPNEWRERITVETEQNAAAAFFQKLAMITSPDSI